MKYIKIISWIVALTVAVSIFIFSSQPAEESNELSIGITEEIINTLPNTKYLPDDVKQNIIADYNNLVRKNAHFLLYLLLGICVTVAISLTFPSCKLIFLLSVSLAVCILYSISDEIHQIFVSGRGCQLRDVLIDSTGSLTGAVIYMGIKKFVNKFKLKFHK